MKYMSIYIDDIIIEVHNSWYCKEIIKVKGSVVSSKYSLFGAKHKFEINNNTYSIEFFMGLAGIQFDLFRNDLPIVESAKNGCMIILGISVMVAAILLLIDKIL
jgi:hypothetical protein